ncbi:hypothetical protein CHLRE_06g289150v5 [Chlamydomonas reinhardtii]|uniref:Cation efflux protein transmembrane domain-containing protein n=1 Tax=Chlamydomonas reinhardtii TaxID=3055 RepID=A0A2K3DQA5_CHLRE|nr:uncharacterized protein CHLRE_06g289150v5 [Chlamydomonas reinhardtii]PNW82678.1 hypothetical protein CHLRE_06g289150v5 [Chlamydomonas reinhardtii]
MYSLPRALAWSGSTGLARAGAAGATPLGKIPGLRAHFPTSRAWQFNNPQLPLHTCAAAASAAAPWPGGDAGDSSSGSDGSGAACDAPPHGSVSADVAAAQQRTAEQRHKDELHTLNVAICVNVLIFGAKLWVHCISGSSALLAEAMHSVADVLNQMLLRIGLMKARKGPTEMHPYGYARDRFIWSLISAVGIFFLGAGASFIHGVHTLMEHRELEHMAWNYGVLAISGVLEGYSLWVATKVVVAGAQSKRMGLLQYIRSGMDPTTVAVMLEDGGAVLGLAIAAACTALAHATGNAMWDAAGSILVGCLLGAIATFLVQKNRQLLIGRSMAPADVAAVQSLLRADPVVQYVTDTKTEEIGAGMYRFKAEVAWDGDQVVGRYLDRCGRDQLLGRLQAAAAANDRAALEALVQSYGRELISAVGAEVDRIEGEIQKLNPGILYVDLETDRGRHDSWRRGAISLGLDNGGGGSSSGGASSGGSTSGAGGSRADADPASSSSGGGGDNGSGPGGVAGATSAAVSQASTSAPLSGGPQQQQARQYSSSTVDSNCSSSSSSGAGLGLSGYSDAGSGERWAGPVGTSASSDRSSGGGGGAPEEPGSSTVGVWAGCRVGGGPSGLELDLTQDRWGSGSGSGSRPAAGAAAGATSGARDGGAGPGQAAAWLERPGGGDVTAGSNGRVSGGGRGGMTLDLGGDVHPGVAGASVGAGVPLSSSNAAFFGQERQR